MGESTRIPGKSYRIKHRSRLTQLQVCGRSVEISRGPVFSKHSKVRGLMPLIQVLIALIVVGVLLWLVNNYIPMQGSIKSILNAVVVIVVVLWLLNVFGLFHSLSNIRVGN
jgi:hypothetical protein